MKNIEQNKAVQRQITRKELKHTVRYIFYDGGEGRNPTNPNIRITITGNLRCNLPKIDERKT